MAGLHFRPKSAGSSPGRDVTPVDDAGAALTAIPVTPSLPTGAATEATLAAMSAKMTGFDLDSGAGTQTVQGVSLRKSASGGSVELGTATNPLCVEEQNVPGAEDNTLNVYAVKNKPLGASTYCYTRDSSSALEAGNSLLNAAGNLRYVWAQIPASAAAGTYYFQLHNHTGTADEGDVPVVTIEVTKYAGIVANVYFDAGENCMNFSTAIYACLSTTQYTKTIVVSNILHIVTAEVKAAA